MSLLQNSNAISAGGYDINNSLRFRSSASAYLNRTPASAGNRKTWTWSGWVKKAPIQGSANTLATFMGCTTGSTDSTYLRFGFYQDKFIVGNNSAFFLQSTPLYRDPSAWYHVVVSTDTTQGSASNRMRIYINGTEVTAWSTDQRSTYLTSSVDLAFNQASQHSIGSSLPNAGDYLDGYLTEVNFVDGSQLTPSSFGETDAVTGVWKAKKYTGTYGTNGFYLPFKNTTAPGFSSYYGSFNGSTQKLTVPASSNFAPGTGDFTVEGWFKTSSIPAYGATVFSQAVSGTNYFLVGIGTGDVSPKNYVNFYATSSGGGTPIYSSTTFEFNTWNHFAVVRQSGVVTVYLNGIGGTPTSNTTDLNNTTYVPTIGQYTHSTANAFSGELSNFRYVKGTAVYTANFTPPTTALTAIANTQLLTLQNSSIVDNSTNALTITNTGTVATTSATVGTYTSFIGDDNSSNNNNWIPNNINYTSSGTTYDAMTDVPTNTSATVANYCVLNPLVASTTATITNGNLNSTGSTTTFANARATFMLSSGKWYWEQTITGSSTLDIGIGLCTEASQKSSSTNIRQTGWYNVINGSSGDIGSSANGGANVTISTTNWATNDIIMVAYDADTGYIWFGRNGTWYPPTTGGSAGNPAAGTNQTISAVSNLIPASWHYNTNASTAVNFGQRPFSYSVPSGFTALNTYNLPTSTIVQGNKYMDTTLWTGDNTSPRSITNSGSFKPDLVWVKGRNGTINNILVDSVRGTSKNLISNSTSAEVTTPVNGSVSAFNSTGFSVASGTSDSVEVNYSVGGTTYTYVGWQWQAGQGTNTTNTAGSITTTVSANTTAGFSIIKFTGTQANATIGHGLGVAPKMVIVKTYGGGTRGWRVYHESLGNTKYLILNDTTAATTDSTAWNNTTPTSTVISLGANAETNNGGSLMIAYAWAEISGFSKIGSYTGNSSTDGPFVYCGFRPKYILLKRSDTLSDFHVHDAARNTYNVTNNTLYPSGSYAEDTNHTAVNFDFTANGFKVRSSHPTANNNGSSHIFIAFAENPFKNSLAR